MNPQARDICERLILFDSQNRTRELLYATIVVPTHVFWPVFLEEWTRCDCVWPYKGWFLESLRRNQRRQPARPYMSADAALVYDALPPLLTVYRGCARYRVRGLSWTTDREIAEKFARGIRFDLEPDRVLAQAVIPKAHIFAPFVSRSENEIVLDPRRLRALQVTPAALAA